LGAPRKRHSPFGARLYAILRAASIRGAVLQLLAFIQRFE
jgi:hypothetical protein